MSKAANRNKKTPMFVSNINANYDFVDYTQPGQAPSNAFGNPNPNQTSVGASSNQSPQKQENNWFDQMLSTQPAVSNSPVKPSVTAVEQVRTPKTETYDTGFSYGFSQNTTSTSNTRQEMQKFSPVQLPNFKKTQQISMGKKDNAYSTYQQTFTSTTTTATFQNNSYIEKPKLQSNFAFSNSSSNFEKTQQPKKYEFSSKGEYSYEQTQFSKDKPSTGFAGVSKNQYTLDEPVTRSEKIKTEPAASSGVGFTNEDLVNSLPQPARSNILAIIRRSKGLAA